MSLAYREAQADVDQALRLLLNASDRMRVVLREAEEVGMTDDFDVMVVQGNKILDAIDSLQTMDRLTPDRLRYP